MSQERFDFKVRNYFFAGFDGDAASLEKGMTICEDATGGRSQERRGSGLARLGLCFTKPARPFKEAITERHGTVAARLEGNGRCGRNGAGRSRVVRIPRGAVLLTASRYCPILRWRGR